MKSVKLKQRNEFWVEEEEDLPPEERTVFIYSLLTSDQQALIDNKTGFQGKEGYNLTIGTSNLLIIHMCLQELVNFHDEDGQEIKIERDESQSFLPGKIRPIKSEIIDQIPIDARNQLANKIKLGGRIEVPEAKN